MNKKDVFKMALMGLAMGTAVCGCTREEKKDADKSSCSSQTSSCGGSSGCNSSTNTETQSGATQAKRDALTH